jgi:putative SOS response-associated peptidase YedK
MCTLYAMTRKQDDLGRFFRVGHNRAVASQPLDAIFPNYNAPVVRRAADGEREIVMMNWGFVLPQPGKAPRRVVNVRDDKILTGFWRDSFEQRRCLVPATSFCEPNGDVKPATWHWFALGADGDPRPLFAFPGVWRRHRGPVKKDGPTVEIETYSFLTTTPNGLVSTINHERMPVLLTREADFETWLTAPPGAAMALAREYPPERMRIVQEGLEKKDLLAD